MCLILFAWQQHSGFPFVLIANRDEYFARPTQEAGYWHDHRDIMGGRDLEQGGTWLGINKQGRFAAVTNYRDPAAKKDNVLSRGLLVSRYLQGEQGAEDYLGQLAPDKQGYAPFNLLLGDAGSVHFFSNMTERSQELSPGIYGIANGELDCTWPKVIKGKHFLGEQIRKNNLSSHENLFRFLTDTGIPADDELPDTGVGTDLERRLAAIFVQMNQYGTRSSSILTISSSNIVSFMERNYNQEGRELKTHSYQFIINH